MFTASSLALGLGFALCHRQTLGFGYRLFLTFGRGFKRTAGFDKTNAENPVLIIGVESHSYKQSSRNSWEMVTIEFLVLK